MSCKNSKSHPLNIQLGIVGGGNMAKSLIMPLLEDGTLNPDGVRVSARTDETLMPWREAGCATTKDNSIITSRSDVIIWAVKPQMFADSIPDSWNYDKEFKASKATTLHISIMAGVTISNIEEALLERTRKEGSSATAIRVVRCMPNIGSQVKCGVLVYTPSNDCDEGDEHIVKDLFSPTSSTYSVKENQINAYCGLSGSGIGFMFPILEAMSDGALRMGIPRDLSLEIAGHVMKGAGELLLKTKKHPALLKDTVCSPGGTTIAGVAALEQAGVRHGVMAAIQAATLKGEEFAKKSK